MSVSDEIRARLNIVDVISEYVSLKKLGKEYKGLCPFHNEKTPSFCVSESKQVYYCFGCQRGGDVIRFVSEYENLDYRESIELLAKKAGVEFNNKAYNNKAYEEKRQILDINKRAAVFYVGALYSTLGAAARKYIDSRGLKKDTVTKFGLGYSPNSWDSLYQHLSKSYDDKILLKSGLFKLNNKGQMTDMFINRIIFPIMDKRSRVIAIGGRALENDRKPKYVNSPETEVFSKKNNLYGLHLATHTKHKFFIACEGYMDVIALNTAGYDNAVASLGTALTANQLHMIKGYTDSLYLMYDSDDAGKKAINRAVPLAMAEGLYLKVVRLNPYKDPDELIKNQGVAEMQKRIDEAINPIFFRMDLLFESVSEKDPDSKLAFINHMVDILSDINDIVIRQEYVSSCAKRYHVDDKLLQLRVDRLGYNKEIKIANEEIKKEDREIFTNSTNSYSTAQSLLLSWLIEDNQIYSIIKSYILDEDFTFELFKNIYILIREAYENKNELPGMFMDNLSKEEESLLSEILTRGADFLNEDSDKSLILKELILKIKSESYDDLKSKLSSAVSDDAVLALRSELMSKKQLIEQIRSIKSFDI